MARKIFENKFDKEQTCLENLMKSQTSLRLKLVISCHYVFHADKDT